MKSIFAMFVVLGTIGGASAQVYGTGSNPYSHYTNGYVRQNGTYVPPHYQTNPNNSTSDNYRTRGNYNPNTGRIGGE